ncbi:MAG: RNA methyltransferase, partial [Sphingobacteriales bacterium]
MANLPEQLLRNLEGIPGFDRDAFLFSHEDPALTSIRQNPAKPYEAWPGGKVVPWCSEGRYLPERPVFTLDPAFHAGAYYVQEASSMFLDHLLRTLLPERKGLRVLDLCAAPGGKSTLLNSVFDSESLILSNEVIRTRVPVLEENLIRWGHTNSWICSNDARDLGKLEGYFDVIVVDAPCSGSGLFRKDPQAIDEWSIDNVKMCSQRQQRILSDIWPALKDDGILVYATCSYSKEEDEDILSWLSSECGATGLAVNIPDSWGIIRSETKAMTGYRFFPDKALGEGFFIAAVRKKESTTMPRMPKWKSQHQEKALVMAKGLLQESDWVCLDNGQSGYNVIHRNHEEDYYRLSKAVYLRKTGLPIGNFAGKDWIPSHELALSIDCSPQIPSVNVDRQDALHFLKKAEFPIPGLERGWYLIRFEGLGLGWIKCIGNRFN